MKGSTEVATCLFRWLSDINATKPESSHIVMYCDCCSDQNRIRQMLAMLVYAIKTLPNVELKFILSGHMHMQVSGRVPSSSGPYREAQLGNIQGSSDLMYNQIYK